MNIAQIGRVRKQPVIWFLFGWIIIYYMFRLTYLWYNRTCGFAVIVGWQSFILQWYVVSVSLIAILIQIKFSTVFYLSKIHLDIDRSRSKEFLPENYNYTDANTTSIDQDITVLQILYSKSVWTWHFTLNDIKPFSKIIFAHIRLQKWRFVSSYFKI